jgi:O-methyltransferase involved in polyketide biosynthesis
MALTTENEVVGFPPRGGLVPLPKAGEWRGQGGAITPNLAGVSETMLWSLHNRASEARRSDSMLVDPDSVRIHEAIDYDFPGHFGDPVGSLAMRAAAIDRALRLWIERHPDGFIISLGEGLETQVRRVDNGRMRWLSVDLPDAIRLRERFLPPTDRFRHIAVSALDTAWMDAVDPGVDVFIVAQGLLMYLEQEAVRQLLSDIADRFPSVEMVFDVVPRWFSRLTLLGLRQTPHYQLPAMPWGINRDELEPTLRRWRPRLAAISLLDYHAPRGSPLLFARMIHATPFLRHEVPSLVQITLAPARSRPPAIPNMKNRRAGPPSDDFDERDGRFKDVSPRNRHMQMTSTNSNPSGAARMSAVLEAGRQNAGRGSDLAVASGQIIAKRMALGMKAAFDPRRTDHAEFARMVPEKMEAFSAASMIMIERSDDAHRRMMRFASDEVATTARGTIAMAGSFGPLALAKAQGRFALAWFDRAASNFFAIGMLALDAQDAVMAPIRQTVTANAERLSQ